MELSKILLYGLVAIAGTFVAAACVRLIWLAIGAYRINRAGPRRLLASRHVLWRDPGDVSRLDVVNGPGGPDGAPLHRSTSSKNMRVDPSPASPSMTREAEGGA